MEKIKILRILVTDICNYDCSYCHNEGQIQRNVNQMKFEAYKRFISSIDISSLKQIRFSGGEPFTNPEIVQMLLWTCDNTKCVVGCATNAAMLNEDIIKAISTRKSKLTINFPSVERAVYNEITRRNAYDKVIENLNFLDKYEVEYSLNFVLKSETFDGFINVLKFAIDRKCNLKILPYTDKSGDDTIYELVNKIEEIIDDVSDEKVTGANRANISWYKNCDSKKIRIRTYVNPCYTKNFEACKSLGELRVQPDFSLKACIISNKSYPMNIDISEKIGFDMDKAWKCFTECYSSGATFLTY